MNRFFCLLTAICLGISIAGWPAHAAEATDVAALLAKARPGSTVSLPAGTFQIDTVQLPPQVSLRGAGYKQTVLEARNGDALVIKGNRDVAVSDLTIRNARGAGVLLQQSENVTLQRLRITGCLTGALLEQAKNCTAQNLLVDTNRTGMIMSKGTHSAFINCSLVNNSTLALSLSGNTGVAVFNNVFINSTTGAYLTEDNQELALDYNLYIADIVGKLPGEAPRRSTESWRDLTGYDAHSITQPVNFADVKAGDYRPITPLSWAPVRATTSDWGIARLAGFSAPARDIDNMPRKGDVDLGAYEVSLPAPGPADGQFTISSSSGVKSAGLYSKDGVNIRFLFTNLPLRKGTYSFWLPSHDFQGKPIPAGAYELRVAEGDLRLEYITLTANGATTNIKSDTNSTAPQTVTFDRKNRLILTQEGFENAVQVRSFDPAFSAHRWEFPGQGHSAGVVVTGKGELFDLRTPRTGGVDLLKLDAETGKALPIENGLCTKLFTDGFSGAVSGITELNGALFVADTTKNKLFYTPADSPTFTTSFDVPAPTSPAADAAHNLIWVISAQKTLKALDAATGAVKYEATPVPAAIQALAVNNGRMAILSRETGKIHLFDCADPANLRPLNTIGRGDSPYGPMLPDRFLFTAENTQMVYGSTSVALSSTGDVAVVDDFRVTLFAPDGTVKKHYMSIWGQQVRMAQFAGDDKTRFFSYKGDYDITLNPKTRSWQPGTFYKLPAELNAGFSPTSFFSAKGHNFGIYHVHDWKNPLVGIVRFEGGIARPVLYYFIDQTAKVLSVRRDTNNDGVIDVRDTAAPVLDARGNPIKQNLLVRFIYPRPDGTLVLLQPFLQAGASNAGFIVPMTGLDADNVPIYAWDKATPLEMRAGKDAAFTSPYDLKSPEALNRFNCAIDFLPDGGYVATDELKTSGGVGFMNNFGTDLVAFDKQGNLRWFEPLPQTGGVGGAQYLDGMVFTCQGTQINFLAFDTDGLGLGVMAPRKEMHWTGFWVDHPTHYQFFTGNDGKPYLILGDYMTNGYHWFALKGADQVKHSRIPVTISTERAAALAAEAAVPYPLPVKLPVTTLAIPKLAQPLPIDGELAKWRALGITPQVIATPETAQGVSDVKDCSAVARLAYEGDNLYVQIIKFDDMVTMHQPAARHYQQDSTELAINGFLSGYKFNVTSSTDNGAIVLRDSMGSKPLIFPPDVAPRVVKVLDNARDVEERKLIESIYRTDLSADKVIITEYKLPISQVFPAGHKEMPKMTSGSSFWLGFYFDDNDLPGADIQKILPWPANFMLFGPKETGALATLE